MAAEADRTTGNNMGTRFGFYDTAGKLREVTSTGFDPERVSEKVRYRTLAAATSGFTTPRAARHGRLVCGRSQAISSAARKTTCT